MSSITISIILRAASVQSKIDAGGDQHWRSGSIRCHDTMGALIAKLTLPVKWSRRCCSINKDPTQRHDSGTSSKWRRTVGAIKRVLISTSNMP
jgi:hypothetical protein